jgi:hypothetical protein
MQKWQISLGCRGLGMMWKIVLHGCLVLKTSKLAHKRRQKWRDGRKSQWWRHYLHMLRPKFVLPPLCTLHSINADGCWEMGSFQKPATVWCSNECNAQQLLIHISTNLGICYYRFLERRPARLFIKVWPSMPIYPSVLMELTTGVKWSLWGRHASVSYLCLFLSFSSCPARALSELLLVREGFELKSVIQYSTM